MMNWTLLLQGTPFDPARQAAMLGFSGASIKMPETGCDRAIDFHFLDDRSVMFALNDRIDRLVRATLRMDA